MDRQRLQSLFRPHPRQLVGCLALSLAVLLATYGSVLFSRLFSGSLLTDSYVKQVSLQQLTRLSDLQGVGLLVQVVFWGGVGLVAYVVYLAITNAVTEARNEIVIEAAYTNKGNLAKRLSLLSLQVGLGLIVFLLMAVTALLLLPLWLGQFEQFIVALPAWVGFLHALVAVLGLAFNLYLVWWLLRAALAVE